MGAGFTNLKDSSSPVIKKRKVYVYVFEVCVCVCVCKIERRKSEVGREGERERERERESCTWRHVLSERFRHNDSLVSLIVFQYDTYGPCGGTHGSIQHMNILNLQSQ